jgi:hypothetical protein
MNTHVIITKEPNQVIPRGYLQEALKQCPTCIGITIQDPNGAGKDLPLLECTAENKTMDVDNLMTIIESCKDVRMVIILAKMDQDFDPETDMQPFVFQQRVEGEEKPENILACHIEGDFPKFSKPGKGHTDEYNFWEECIYPAIEEKFEDSDDLLKFYKKIAGTPMRQLCENPIGHRGIVVFVPLEGDIIAFGTNDIGGEFDWGTTSNTFEWGKPTKLEKAAEAAVETVKKAGGRLSRLMGTTSTPAVSVPSTPTPAPDKEEKETKIVTDQNGVHHTSGNDPWKRWPGTSAKTHVMRTIPSGLVGNARNRWIRVFLNLDPSAELPKGKDAKDFMIPVPLPLDPFAQEDVTTNDAVRELADRVKKFPGNKGGPVTQADPKKEDVKNPAAEVGSTRPTADFLPECPADEAKVSAELVTEWATNPKQPTSLEVQRIETKWPLFTKSRGITLENVARWSIAEKKLFTKKCPNDAARLISELVLKLHEFGAFDPAVNTEHVNDKTTDVEVNVTGKEEDKSKNKTPPGPGPAPAKGKGRLARLTGTAA